MLERLLACVALCAALAAQAAPADTLREFIRDVKSGRATFTQTVTSADGARKKVSSGSFEFARPNRFRFTYTRPFEQLIVGDGEKVWVFDTDLNQASSRKMTQALGATPAALLAGASLDADFVISSQPPADGLEWALALPKGRDGAFQSMRVGFRGKDLAAVEIIDSFGQRSLLQFSGFAANAPFEPDHFRFTPPPGADVIQQ